ncbi:MAG: hypothetical protein E6I65_07870 [Chloroflexi bacterium]|nr:MAG: hypothetical protein E6I65_07870 [Chloroflexota bacterium]
MNPDRAGRCITNISSPGPNGSTIDFWFARSLPGMPIRYRSTVGGQVTSEVVVIEDAFSIPEEAR